MPVEFALRPRIRLREAPAPPRRARARLPKFALPALTYWLAIGGLVYAFVQHHEPSPLPAETEAALAPLPAPEPPAVRPWWRPLPARPAPDVPVAPLVQPTAQQPERETPSSEIPLAEQHATPPSEQPELSLDSEPRLDAEPPVSRELPFDSDAALGVARRATKRIERRSAAIAPSEQARTPDPSAALSLPPLDEPAPAALPIPNPAPTHASAPPGNARPAVTGGLPSCESAIASASQEVDFSGGNRAADLPSQAIAAVLENGVWLSSCNVPERTSLEICVAIKGGRVVGASVGSRPADASVNACVRRRASSLQFPYSPHLDVARTRF